MSDLLGSFLDQMRDADPALASRMKSLDAAAQAALGGVLGRFDRDSTGSLSGKQRDDARGLLRLLRHVDADSLGSLNKVLDYLDLNENAKLEAAEVELASEIMTIFARAESADGQLSRRELEMLYAVLRHLDADDSHSLDLEERRKLRRLLERPAEFLAGQRANNPLLKKLLEAG